MFKKLSAAASLLFFSGAVGASELPKPENTLDVRKNADEEMAFVFEVVRHGARAPIEDRDLDKFPVGEGLLTPEGMRQRYLLGRRNRQRYVEEWNLISDEYTPGEVYMQSTNVNRTMQSGYSELMGLYPPGAGERLTPDQSKAVGSFSAPPFKVRDADKINQELKGDTMPQAFVQVPLTEYNNNDIHDDASTYGCSFINDVGTERKYDTEIWEQFDWMKEQTQEPIEAALDVTQEYMDSLETWHDYQLLTDTVVALDFEGYPEHEELFSDEQWEITNETQHVWLVDDYSKDANNLMMSRVLRKPLAIMKSKVANMLGKETITEGVELSDSEADLKYMIYSAHDTQVVNMMAFLQKEFTWVPFASTVFFELKFSAKCLASDSADENCFDVAVIYNGIPQVFDDCNGHTNQGYCTFPEFIAYVDSVWYSGPSAPDLDAACFTQV